VFTLAIETSFNFLGAEFAELFAASIATAFQSPMWLASFYGRLPAANHAEPLIVVVRDADGRLVMVLPLVRRRIGGIRVIEFADLRVSDYLSPVVSADAFARMAGDTRFRHELIRLLKPFDTIRVPKLRQGSIDIERLFGARPRRPMGMNAYAVDLHGDFDSWREQHLTPSYRKELDKKSRQLHRKGDVQFACVTEVGDIRRAFEALRVYRGIRFGDTPGGEVLQIPHYFDFYLEVATEGAGRVARVYQLSVDGKPAAVVVALLHRGSCLVIMGGFDHAGYKSQSIGALTFQMIAKDCIARGDRELDFTIGDEPYKQLFGAQPRPMWTMSRPGSVLGAAADLAVERLPFVKDVVKRLFSAPHRHGATPTSRDDD